MATPRTCGRLPSQRLRPALPIDTFSWSRLPTCPIVATHSTLILRISPEGMRTDAYSPSRATSCTDEPALRAIWPPLPGLSSTLWMVVPSGMFFNGRQLPGRMSTLSPDTIVPAARTVKVLRQRTVRIGRRNVVEGKRRLAAYAGRRRVVLADRHD